MRVNVVAAAALMDAVERSRPSTTITPAALGEVVHVSSGVGVRMRDALDRLVQAFGVNVDVVEEDGLVGGRRPTDGLTSGSTKSGASVFCASREKFERLVGVRPLIVLEQTLEDIVRHERASQTT